jgi:hypothetical protein
MVVGRATEARPAANFHTRFFSLIFLIPDCISEVGAEFDYSRFFKIHVSS